MNEIKEALKHIHQVLIIWYGGYVPLINVDAMSMKLV